MGGRCCHTCGMTESDAKADLRRYLQAAREALVWKLDGLSEYDARRPMVPTGTNLLGLVKHVASVEAGYLGETFGRPFPEPLPWLEEGAEANADMWATADAAASLNRPNAAPAEPRLPRTPRQPRPFRIPIGLWCGTSSLGCTSVSGRTRTPRSTRWRWMLWARCRGGRGSGARSPCNRSWCT